MAIWASAAFVALMGAFWLIAAQFGMLEKLGAHPAALAVSFALLLAPYWGFGFGLGEWLRSRLWPAWLRYGTAALLLAPYLVYALAVHQFQWMLLLEMLAVVLAVIMVPNHWAAIAILVLAVELHVLDRAWPVPGLSGLAKLLLVDAALYRWLVARPLENIGYDLRVRWSDWRIGLREFLLYTPIALATGFALGFLHVHRAAGSVAQFAAGWLFTVFFIAIPEEILFRGVMLNLLQRRVGAARALWITSVVFGLAHFNKRAAYFNWRYVILAAIAGVFYGRAWLAGRRVAASSITHATVDTVWSIWLR